MFVFGAKYFHAKNGETRCACCGTPCQGFKGPDGRILCYDCYVKTWGSRP